MFVAYYNRINKEDSFSMHLGEIPQIHEENLEPVCNVFFSSKEEAFSKLQDLNNRRSMMVGDLVYDLQQDKWWLILPFGWALVKPLGAGYHRKEE